MTSSWAVRYGLPTVAVAMFLTLWTLISEFEVVHPAYLPPPRAVFGLFISGAFIGDISGNLFLTIVRALSGFAIAAAIGIPLGVLIGRSTVAERLFAPFVEFLRPLPSSAIIPVALLFLGLGTTMKVTVIAFGCVWPILVSTIEGASNVDRTLYDTSRLLHFSRFRKLISLYLPAAAPFIAAGMRTSLAVSLILAVTAEMIVGGNGMGFYIIDMERAFRTAEMYAAIIVLGVVGYLLNVLFVVLKRKLVYWI